MDSLKVNNVAISESIRLSAVQTDKFKAGTITLSLSFPTDAKSVTFSTVLCGVLKKSNKKFPSISAVYKRLDELYSSTLDIRTSFNAKETSISFCSELLDNSYAHGTDVLDGVIELISLSLLQPLSFKADTVKREVETVKSALLAEPNNTHSYALIRCKEMLNRQCASYPSIEDMLSELSNINPDSLWEFYKNTISYAPLDVFYVGSIPPSEVANKLNNHFKGYKPTQKFTFEKPYCGIVLPFAEKREKMSVSQSKLALGFHTESNITSGNYQAALVFNELFGCSPISKLFTNVREKLGLCYYCASSYNVFSGFMIVSCGTDLSRIDLASKKIIEQLDSIKRGEISDAELYAAKKSLTNAYRQIYDNPFDINSFYSNRIKLGINESIEDCINAFEKTEVSDIVKVANSIVFDTSFIIEGMGGDVEEDFYE